MCIRDSPRAASKIHLVSRDVRAHPEYEGALLVTAALVNRAGYAQAYPRVVFTLYNVNGQSIASRTFAPEEYLETYSGPRDTMPAEQPVQIVLELLAPEEAGVSFEFKFL